MAFVLLEAARAQSPAPIQVTAVEGITEYRLANGLDVLLFPDNSKPTVTVNATYFVGSRHEGYGESGMAHLLEHMLFKGTSTRPDLIAELRNHGADFNGSTTVDRTNFFETMPAGGENLRWALAMEADRMVNSRVSRAGLDSEMAVVRNEFEARENNPARVLQERVMATAYLAHAYGRGTIGSLSDIENVPIERLQAFYRTYYQPDNALLIVAGRFDPAQTLAWIQDTFGAIPRPTRKLVPTYTREPVQDGEREVMLRRAGDNQVLMIAFHVPAAPHQDVAALRVLAAILGDTPSGRLYAALVETGKSAAGGATVFSFHDPGLFMVTTNMRREQSFDDVEAAMLRVIDSALKHPPSPAEVERVRTRLLKDIELELADSTRVGLILSDSAATGDWRLLFSGRDEIARVAPQDVARVAQQYLKPSNRTIGRFIPTDAPDRAEIPPAPNVSFKLRGYTGNPSVQAGEDFDPTAANIEARVIRATLPNGLKLVMLPKRNRGGTVVASFNLHFGTLGSLRGRTTAGQFAGALLMRGTTAHTRQQLQDELDRRKAQMNAGGSANGATTTIQTVRDSLIPALRLAAEVLRKPVFPASDLEQLRQQRIASLENTRSQPQPLAVRALNHHIAPYPPDDPRAYPLLEESLAQIRNVSLDDVRRFYADFYGASNAEVAIVGDFDPAAVQQVLTETLGDWRSPQPYRQVQREWTRIEPATQTIETPDKPNAVLMAAITFPVSDEDPDFTNLQIANHILGSNPKSRLFRRIRDRDGLSSNITTVFNAGSGEQFGTLMLQALCSPQNAAKVEAAIREELAKAATEGFTDQEVEEAKATLLQDNLVQRAQDIYLASTLARYEQHGQTMARLEEILGQIRAATPESVNAAFRKWIQPGAFSFVQAGDFARAPGQ